MILPQKITNYFTLFDIKQEFMIDLVQLNINYKKLQQQYHPDNLYKKYRIYQSDVTADTLTLLEELSGYCAYINFAYKTLNNKLTRAIHLLECLTQHETTFSLDKQVLDLEFLEQQMMIHELIDELHNNSGIIHSNTDSNKLQQELDVLLNNIDNNINTLFDQININFNE